MLLSVRDLRRLHLAASFKLGAGECVVLRGASGSGKTQLLRAIADLDPNAGTVLLDGTPREAVPAPAWRRLIAYIPAEPGWWADTVGEHFPDWAAAAPLAERLGLPAAVEALVAERRVAAGAGVVWVTHDAAQAGRVGRPRLLLRDGRVEDAEPLP